MKFIRVYFGRRTRDVVQNGVLQQLVTYIYSSHRAFKASISIDGVDEQFSVTYWDGQPSVKKEATNKGAKPSISMWLNGKTREQALAYKSVYGDACYLLLHPDGKSVLVSDADFNADASNTDKLVTAEQARAIVEPDVSPVHV
jgi:hypothetical protein